MFVERLTNVQMTDIMKKIRPKTVYRFETELHYAKEPYVEFFLYDKEIGNYSVCLYDTYLTCKYKSCNYQLKEMAVKAFKELYNIFGEEYKRYFLEQVNSIFK